MTSYEVKQAEEYFIYLGKTIGEDKKERSNIFQVANKKNIQDTY